jgi:methyl-accepting chemotaxis protein
LRTGMAHLRRLGEELLEGAAQLTDSSQRLVSVGQSLARGASEQAESLAQSASSADGITAITRKNTENTRAVAGLMSQTAQLVDGANHNLEAMVRSMKEIDNSSEKISRIIKVIDEIAFQTNILALNAAVEAARAGEAGMGFAVVAEEVRNLAQRSAQAAQDTAALIEESISKSQEGGKKLQQVAGSIGQITGSASQVKVLVDEVEAGSQEQERGIEQIATAVGRMEQVTRHSVTETEQSSADIEQLAAQARSLYAVVERMKGLVGGSQKPRPRIAPAPPRSGAATVPPNSVGLARLGKPLSEGIPMTQISRSSFPLEENEQRV